MIRELRSVTGGVWLVVKPDPAQPHCDHRGGLVPDLDGLGAQCQHCGAQIPSDTFEAMLRTARAEQD